MNEPTSEVPISDGEERRKNPISESVLMEESVLAIKQLAEDLDIKPDFGYLETDPHFWFLLRNYYIYNKNRVDTIFDESQINNLLTLDNPALVEECKIKLALTTSFDLIARGETDSLTESWNRKSLEERISFLQQLLFNLDKENSFKIAFYYIDLDDFKVINDSFGHRAGDIVLQEFAAAAQDLTRFEDSVFRIGGEEFGILLLLNWENIEKEAEKRGVSARQIVKDKADELRLQIIERVSNRLPIALQQIPELEPDRAFEIAEMIKIGLSIGLSLVDLYANPKSAISEGDELMYKAKQLGKNRVVASWDKEDTFGSKVEFFPELKRRLRILFTGK